MSITDAPIYKPSKFEFADPLLYIQSIRAEAQRSGICKIIPPEVEFLTRLVVFWQNERRRRRREETVVTTNAASTTGSSAATPRQPGKRRSESELLSDPRRRPNAPLPSSYRTPAQQQLAEQAQNEFQSSSVVRELKESAATHASRNRNNTASKPVVKTKEEDALRNSISAAAAMCIGPTSSTGPSSRESGATSGHALCGRSSLEDDNNFTLDGVTLLDGEIVNPQLKKGVDVDLFLLYEFVQKQYGGFSHIMKKQWIDLVKLIRTTSHLLESQQQFRPNHVDEEHEYGYSHHSAHAQSHHTKPKSLSLEDESGAQLIVMAEEMRKAYRTHLLPFEEYIEKHRRAGRAAGSDGSESDDDSASNDNSATSDKKMKMEVDEDGSASSSSSSDSRKKKRQPLDDIPFPFFSEAEIKKWPMVAAQKASEEASLQQLTDMNADPSTSDAAKAARFILRNSSAAVAPLKPDSMSDSPSSSPDSALQCSTCSQDTLAPICQCYHCKRSFHLACLTTPLYSAPILPWYCADCVSAGSFGFEEGDTYDMQHYEARASEFKHAYVARHCTSYVDTKCPYHPLFKAAQRAASSHSSPFKGHNTSGQKLPSGPCVCEVPPSVLNQHYWNLVETGDHTQPLTVEYGSDLDSTEVGSGFPSTGVYARSGWNLNNLPKENRSLLKHLTNISGVTSPWIYIGMLFSSFCWHTEDHYTYSINYVHHGAPKQWYGIPSHGATAFETASRQALPHLFAKQPDLLFQIVTMVSPRVLAAKGVPVYSVTQRPGEFVLTFPQSYHGGFNHGVNIAEAVNFAPPDWLPFAIRSVERYRSFSRTPVFTTDLLLMSLAKDPLLDVNAACWLLPCLTHARNEEVVLREHLRAFGLTKALRWTYALQVQLFGELDTHDPNQTAGDKETMVPLKYIRGKMKKNMKFRKVTVTHQCVHCKHAVYLSCIWCSCKPDKVACLRHASYLCNCGIHKQTLLMRYHIDELDRAVKHVAKIADPPAPTWGSQDPRSFRRMELSYETEVECVEDIAEESAVMMADTEVPVFVPNPDQAKSQEILPPFAQPARKSNNGRDNFHNQHDTQQLNALHANYQFLKHATEKAEKRDTQITVKSGQSTDSLLESVRTVLYPVPPCVTPLTRSVVTAPPLNTVRKDMEKRTEKWLQQLKPYLVASFHLKQKHKKLERTRKRSEGIDTDSSDDDDDSNNEDDLNKDEAKLEFINFNGEPDESALLSGGGNGNGGKEGQSMAEQEARQEERIDRELYRMLDTKLFQEAVVQPSTPTGPTSRSRASKAAAAAAAPPPKAPEKPSKADKNNTLSNAKLTLPQVREFIEEGRSLMWSTSHSREINIVFHKLSQWERLVSKIQQFGSISSADNAVVKMEDEEENLKQIISRAAANRNMKEELSTARRLILAANYAPLDFSSSAPSAGATSSTSPLRTNNNNNNNKNWSAQINAHMSSLKAQVAAAEELERKIEALFKVDVNDLSGDARDAHPDLYTRDQLCELQEAVNALPLTFPIASRLETLIVKMSHWTRRSAIVMSQPLPVAFSFEQLQAFSSKYRPWLRDPVPFQPGAVSAPGGHTTTNQEDANLKVGDIESARTCLIRLQSLQLKHPFYAALESNIQKVKYWTDCARRLLYLSFSHALIKDKESFRQEGKLAEAAAMRADRGPNRYRIPLKELEDLNAEVKTFVLEPKVTARRLVQLLEAYEEWRTNVRDLLHSPPKSVNQSANSKSATNPGGHSLFDGKMIDQLKTEYDEMNIEECAEYKALVALQGVSDFFAQFQAYFVTPLSSSYPSHYYNFRQFQPNEWFKLLNKVFDVHHPCRPEWQQQSWMDVLQPYFKEQPAESTPTHATGSSSEAPHEPSTAKVTPAKRPAATEAASPTEMEGSANKKAKTSHAESEDSDVEMIDSNKIKNKSSTGRQSMDIEESKSGSENDDDNNPEILRRSSRVVEKRNRSDEGEEEEDANFKPRAKSGEHSVPLFTTPATPTTPTAAASVHPPTSSAAAATATTTTTAKPAKAGFREMLKLMESGRELLAKASMTATMSDATSMQHMVASLISRCSSSVQQHIHQIEEFFQLACRIQQHLAHLTQLKRFGQMFAPLPPSASEQAIEERNKLLDASAGYFDMMSSPTNPPSVAQPCNHYPPPQQCPFYSIIEIEKLYVLSKLFENTLGLNLVGAKLLKEAYTQAYNFQLSARRLTQYPYLPTPSLLLPDGSSFQQALFHQQNLIERSASVKRPVELSQLRNPSHLFWSEVIQNITFEGQFDINLKEILQLLHAESPATATVTKLPPFILRKKPGSTQWTTHYINEKHEVIPAVHNTPHTLPFHPLNHASYTDLLNKYAELLHWAGRAKACVASLKHCFDWCELQPLQLDPTSSISSSTPPIYHASGSSPCTRVVSTVSPFTTIRGRECVESLASEAVRKGFHSPLLRKIRQASWALQCYDALAEGRCLNEIASLYATSFSGRCKRAWQKKLSNQTNPINVDDTTPTKDSPTASPSVSSAPPSTDASMSSSELSALLNNEPASEFDAPGWTLLLERCASRGWNWLDEARVYSRKLRDLQDSVHQLHESKSSLTLDLIHYDKLLEFTRSACQCLNVSTCPELKQFWDRLETCQVWCNRIRTWFAQGKANWERMHGRKWNPNDPAGNTTASSTGSSQTAAAGAATSPPAPAGPVYLTGVAPGQASAVTFAPGAPQANPRNELSRISMSNLLKLIKAGQSTLLMSTELETLLKLQSLNRLWVTKLEALFTPRHQHLNLRNLLKSLTVPVTSEEEKDKLKALMHRLQIDAGGARQKQPVPDSNELYCICKRPYDDTKFMIACDECSQWYHGECVNVPIAAAQQLLSYVCPKCSDKNPSKPYQFGTVLHRHARPALVQCQQLYHWINSELDALGCGSELLIVDHVRSFRNLLLTVDVLNQHVKPWLTVIEEEKEFQRASNFAVANGGQPLPRPPVSPLFADPLHLSHLKGCIRQGKKLGINFPELIELKRRYDQARDRIKPGHAHAHGAPVPAAAAPGADRSVITVSPPPPTAAAPSNPPTTVAAAASPSASPQLTKRETIEID